MRVSCGDRGGAPPPCPPGQRPRPAAGPPGTGPGWRAPRASGAGGGLPRPLPRGRAHAGREESAPLPPHQRRRLDFHLEAARTHRIPASTLSLPRPRPRELPHPQGDAGPTSLPSPPLPFLRGSSPAWAPEALCRGHPLSSGVCKSRVGFLEGMQVRGLNGFHKSMEEEYCMSECQDFLSWCISSGCSSPWKSLLSFLRNTKQSQLPTF